jgi:hypothetical protein
MLLTFALLGTTLLFASAGWADIPAPPANQLLGIVDGIFNNLTEAECRACHDDPNNSCTTSNVDRHHLQYGLPLSQGECSVNSNACLSDTDCDPDICENQGNTCSDDTDCQQGLGETCGEVCRGETAVPNPYENPVCSDSGTACDIENDNTDCPAGETCGVYGCLSCHDQANVGGVITFLVERDCLQCHIQIPGEASVHHLTAVAQGFDSPLGVDTIGDCTPCHGTLVDDIGDGHMIPPYAPSLVTPSPSGGYGEPDNSYGNGAGACDYCHDQDTDPNPQPPIPPIEIYANKDTHHNTGLMYDEYGNIRLDQDVCLWCHNVSLPGAYAIRVCEGCHGYESLHNIQVDSDGTCSTAGTLCNVDSDCPTGETCEGTIVVGGELAGYGHVGANNPGAGDDCWGCHGFSFASASALGSGPVVPAISSSDAIVMTAGTDTSFILTGSAFTNLVGTYEWVSDVLLTAADGSSVTLTPDSITQRSLTVTIPGTTATGNYMLQAVKGVYAASNPVAISIKPEVVIDDVVTVGSDLTITGSGFGDSPPEGSGDYLNVEVNGVPADISSWTDTEITASVSGYGASSAGGTVTVNALYCNATFAGSTCEGCAADCNNDGTVNVVDLLIMKGEFLQTPVLADCNGDGNVDLFDLIILISEYQRDNCCRP